MTSMPHDVDVKALLRLCTLYNVVLACNQASADFVLGSPLFDSAMKRRKPTMKAISTGRFLIERVSR